MAFLLPWQTRWMFYETLLGGQPFDWGVLSLYAVELLLLAVIIGSGLPKIEKRAQRLAMLVVAIVIVCLASVGPAISDGLAFVATMHIAFATLFFIGLLDERVSMTRVIVGFCAGLVGPSLLGIYQTLFGGSGPSTLLGLATRDVSRLGEAVFEIANGARIERAYGSFPHPNIFGGYLAIGMIGLLSLWRRTKEKRDQMLIGLGLALFVAAMICAFSRSAILGLGLGLLVGAIVLRRKKTQNRIPDDRRVYERTKKLSIFVVALVFIVLAFASTFAAPMIASRINSDSPLEARSVSERVEQYRDWPAIVDGHWLFGRGAGNYTIATREVFNEWEWWQYQPIHNAALLIIAEIGVVGFVILTAWIASVVSMTIGRVESRPYGEGVTAIAMGCVLLVVAMFDHYLWSLWPGLALTAMVMAISVRAGQHS